MTAPTTPSPERQPADAGGVDPAAVFARAICESEGREWTALDNSREDCERWFAAGRACAALSIPAPQAQPDARAVEGEPVAWRVRRLTDDPEEWQLRPVGAALDFGNPRRWEIQPLYLSAPAADDGWRPSREEVAKRVYEAMRWAARHAENQPAPEWVEGGNSDAQYQARREADRILALHPAAPTDEVGK